MRYKSGSRRFPPRVHLAAAAVASCFLTLPAWANPTNPAVVSGTATFNQVGSTLTVTNSNGAIIHWDKFSIGAGETTHFAQTSASSSVLNRVLAGDPSTIFGTLSSNGKVWLINPAGIMVGAGGRVDTAAFVASTLSVTNADFVANKLNFGSTLGSANVVNQGQITTPQGGSVYLIGSNVNNEGIITTPQGETILAAGARVSLIDSATPGVKVEITGAEGNATNLGEITAEAGRVGIAGVLVRNSGQINAGTAVAEGGRVFLKASKNVTVDGAGRIVASGTSGGEVELQAGETTSLRGRIEAEGSEGSGGKVDLFGKNVGLFDSAYIAASGQTGGGSVRIGGDFQGANALVPNAQFTYFGTNATVVADAQKVGAGGTVIVWSDDTTRAYGNVSALGGVLGGDGGFVEVSGKQNLDFMSTVRIGAGAAGGNPGTLLLDPMILWIADFGGSLPQIGDPASPFAALTKSLATISPAALAAVGGNISLAATEELIIDDPITLTAAGASLTATAGIMLAVTPGSTITTNGGAVSLTGGTTRAPVSTDDSDFPLAGNGTCTSSANCWAAGSLLMMAPVNTAGGTVNLRAQTGNLYLKDTVSSGGGGVTLQAGAGIFGASFHQPVNGASYFGTGSVNAGAGNLSVTAGGNIYLNGGVAATGGISMTATSGSIQNYGTTSFGAGTLSFTAPFGITSYYLSGSGLVSASSASSSLYLESLGPMIVASATSGSSVTLRTAGNLTLGNVSGSSVSLYSSSSGTVGGVDASSKVTATSSFIDIDGSAGVQVGTTALPLVLDTSQLFLDTVSTINVQFPAAPTRTLSYLDLNLSATGLGTTSSIAGGPVLGSGFTLSSNGSLVTSSLTPLLPLSTFDLTVSNGALTMPTVSGAATSSLVLRSDGALSLPSVTGNGSVSFSARSNNATVDLGNVVSVGAVNVLSATGVILGSVAGTSASLGANSGSIVAAADNSGYELNVGTGTATLNVSNGSIGGINGLNIKGGNINLTAGGVGSIGSAAKPVVLETTSTVTLTTPGSFNVLGQDTAATPLNFSRLTLTMSASGMGASSSVGSANFTGNLFQPTSNGTTISLQDLINPGFTNGLFLTANNGSVDLGQVQSTTGQFSLTAQSGSITQAAGKHIVMGTQPVSVIANGSGLTLNNVTAGGTTLRSNNGLLSVGTLNTGTVDARSWLDFGAVSATTTGSARFYANNGNLSIGDIFSSSSVELFANLNLTAGTVSGTSIYLEGFSSVTAGALTGTSSIQAYNYGGGGMSLGDIRTGVSNVTLQASGDLLLGSVATSAGGRVSNLNISTNPSSAAGFGTTNITGASKVLRANSATISSFGTFGGIDLTGTTVDVATANLSAGNGTIVSALTGTNNLTLSTGNTFTVTTDTALTNLNVSGHADKVGSSTLSAPGQSYAFSGGTASDLNISTSSGITVQSLTLNLSDFASGYGGVINGINSYGGSVNVTAYADFVSATNIATYGGAITLNNYSGTLSTNNFDSRNAAATAAGTVSLYGDGNVAVSNMYGGNITIQAGSGHLSVGNVMARSTTLYANDYIDFTGPVATTFASPAAGATLTAESSSGSITMAPSASLSVGTSSVTLDAEYGSVGSAANPIAIHTNGNLSQLHVRSKDDVVINLRDSAGTTPVNLAHFDLTFTDSPLPASPIVAIDAANLPASFITRNGSGAVTVAGGATPGLNFLTVENWAGSIDLTGDLGSPLQSVTLDATGDLTLNGNIAATAYLNLYSDNDVLITAGASARSISGSGFDISAGRDIVLTGGTTGGASLGLTGTTSTSYLYANRDVLIDGAVGGATVNNGSGSFNIEGRDIVVKSGSGGATVATTSTMYIYSGFGGTNGFRLEAQDAAAIVSAGNQNIYTYNGISVLGGTSANSSALLSATGSQYLYSYSPSLLTVRAGDFSGASAWVKAGSSQDIYYFSNLNLTAGNAANAFAKVSAGSSQYAYLYNGASLTAGNTEGASAELLAVSSQQLYGGSGNITLTGGSSANAGNLTLARIANSGGSASQIISTSGAINLLGGGANSKTSISQGGTGNQTINAGALSMSSTAAASGGNSFVLIEKTNATNTQDIDVAGSLLVSNGHSADDVVISAAGRQDVDADTILISVGSANSSTTARAAITAGGDQDVWADTLLHVAAFGAGTASIESAGLEQSVGAFKFSPTGAAPTGTLLLGDATATGKSKIMSTSASGFQEVIAAASMTILGGVAGSESKIFASSEQSIGIIAGGLTLNGGAGKAEIDPTTQSIITNGTMSLTNATIAGGTSNLVTTSGNVSLNNSKLTSTTLKLVSAGNTAIDSGSTLTATSATLQYGGSYSNTATIVGAPVVAEPVPVFGSVAVPPVVTDPLLTDTLLTGTPLETTITAAVESAEIAPSETGSLDSSLSGGTEGLLQQLDGQTVGGTEESFGGSSDSKSDEEEAKDKKASDQSKDEKKDDKPAQKAVAQCS